MDTLRDVRRANLVAAGLPPESVTDAWFDWAKIGPVHLPLPNPPARRRVIHIHDAAHVLSGYGTDIYGEFEESAFELGAGCSASWIALFINLQGLVGGMLIAPSRTTRAWRRGEASGSPYEVADLDALLDLPVEAARARLGIPAGDPGWADGGPTRLAIAVVGGFVSAAAQLVALAAVPVGLWWALG